TWTWTVRDLGQHVLREYASAGGTGASSWTWKKDYVWRDSALLATEASGGVRLHFHLDHLGTPRVVTNQAGQVVGRHDYYAFGTELSSSVAETPEEAVGTVTAATYNYRHFLQLFAIKIGHREGWTLASIKAESQSLTADSLERRVAPSLSPPL